MPDDDPKAAYERLRAAHLTAVRASLEDHVARLDWPHQRIERYQTERLRSLLAYARERSPFHVARMANIDPATATIDDLARLPPMLKQEAQNDWDAIITAPDITHARAEQVLAQQPWFSYTPRGIPDIQLRRLERRTRCVCLGLGAVRHTRLSRLAMAGAC